MGPADGHASDLNWGIEGIAYEFVINLDMEAKMQVKQECPLCGNVAHVYSPRHQINGGVHETIYFIEGCKIHGPFWGNIEEIERTSPEKKKEAERFLLNENRIFGDGKGDYPIIMGPLRSNTNFETGQRIFFL